MIYTIFENLQGFGRTRPPLVIFMVCLGAFAVVLLTLAYVIKVHDNLSNPDLTEDWNKFFDKFDDLQFCIVGNSSDYDVAVQRSSPKLKHVMYNLTSHIAGTASSSTSIEKPVINLVEEEFMNTSVSMLVHITPTPQFLSNHHNSSYFYTTINGSQLGFTGSRANMAMNVSITIPFEWNATYCPKSPCRPIQIYSCVTFLAPFSFFPGTRQPGGCYSTVDAESAEFRSRMIGHHINDLLTCGNKALLSVQHDLDPHLSMMLSIEDRSVINLHLMHTSYFLFVMFVTIFCYALVKGKATGFKLKQTNYSEVRTQV